MGFVLPEVVIQKVITHGLRQLRQNRPAFDDLFSQYIQDELNNDYGQSYLDYIWDWFSTAKIPVVKAWSLNSQNIPCISIHLANEAEDEQKAAFYDFAGDFSGENETGTGVFTVMIDIGIHAGKDGDHVLWLYYIVSYILFKHKLMAHRLGLKLHTYSASDYNKEAAKMGENVWTRWIRFKCTTQNFWDAEQFGELEEINLDPQFNLTPAVNIATSLDVNISEVDVMSNDGFRVGRIGDEKGDDDMSL